MPKTYRYKKPGNLSTYSPVPVMYGMREFIDTMNLLSKDIPKRLDKGRKLFLLSMADMIRKDIREKAPEIDVGNENFPYAEHLRIAIVDGVDDMESVAIYLDNKYVNLTGSNIYGKILFFQPTKASPKFVDVLMVYGPWPANMIPVKVNDISVRIISRNAREDEINTIANRIYKKRTQIENDLKNAGAKNVSIGLSSNFKGVVVKEDLSYNILRHEFGVSGYKEVAHWRPALKNIPKYTKILMEKYLKYLVNGRDGVFDLPDETLNVNVSNFDGPNQLARVLAPFVKQM